ncbi:MULTISPECIES: DNA-3-methyladenine glycosylase 2 family protein [unclassified Solwaraspora]|uniref:DNA-3-methyladenine glycosylase 2 family protein n=1 Tax=unclassified Solwaraspora TaxID=2627926 RepID=UPI00259B94E3|nr:AlkA N-terminal domain-containing protein [Solwaraspora sp. WMMA2056]WJK40557.1 AlkA N-terminal domain-containing protein [Solwaraspora sp. WMMA2056]
MELDFERCYRAVDSRDQRFDGWFYTGVTSTGIYCRPSCPAVTPKRVNVRFFVSAAAAQQAGLRACRRCHPDATPGSPDWDLRADLVGRAMRLIRDGVVDRDGVSGLARRLGYTERHLNRVLTDQLGAGPLALARAQRAQTARILIERTALTVTDIAFAAGFGSVRQFNDTFRTVYGLAPTVLRGRVRAAGTGPDRAGDADTLGAITVRLAFRQPMPTDAVLDFLAARAVPGVEAACDSAYRRALRLPHGPGTVAVTPHADHFAATFRLADLRDLAPAVARCRALFDLDADPVAVDATLGAEPAFAPVVAATPGMRVPGTVDGFELAVRAVVGQQISVAAARRVLARLCAAAAGDPTAPDGDDPTAPDGDRQPVADELVPFPSPTELLELPDAAFAMPAARRATLRTLAVAVADGTVELDPGADRAELVDRLGALPGIGPWTTGYVAMRALADPDVLLGTDLGVRHGARLLDLPTAVSGLTTHATRWRPWRSYATLRLWQSVTIHNRLALVGAGRNP